MPDRLIALSVLCLTAAASLAACSSSTSATRQSSSPAPQAEPEINHDAWSTLGYRWEWTGYPLKAGNARLTEVVVAGDIIVTTATDTTVSALEASTGKVRWAKRLDRVSTQLFEPVRVGDTLLINSDTDHYQVDVRTGNTLDKDSADGVINTPPLRVGNLALMGTTRDELIAIRTDQGFVRWRYAFDGQIQAPPVDVDGRAVAMVSGGGDLRIIDGLNGSSLATASIAGGAVTDMLVEDGTLFVASTDQSLYAFNTSNASRLWRLRTSAPLTVQPVIIDGVLYTTTRDTGLAAIDKDTGEILWSNDTIGGWVVTKADGRDLIAWNGRDIMLVDGQRGELISSAPLEGVMGVRSDSHHDGDIYTISADGSVAKFSPK